MSKATAPLLSFGASGQLGQTLVYGKWKGISYARRYVVPANPQTAEQTTTRNCFSFLQSVYKVAPSLVTDVWQAYATGKPLTDRNAFTKFNLPLLRGEADLANFVFSPGALGGLPPISMVTTPGAGQMTVDVTAPATVPSGWTIYSAIVAAIEDQDPDTGVLYTMTAGEDLTSTYQVVLTGLNANPYYFGAWLKWNRPDGQFAYSPAIVDTDSPS